MLNCVRERYLGGMSVGRAEEEEEEGEGVTRVAVPENELVTETRAILARCESLSLAVDWSSVADVLRFTISCATSRKCVYVILSLTADQEHEPSRTAYVTSGENSSSCPVRRVLTH